MNILNRVVLTKEELHKKLNKKFDEGYSYAKGDNENRVEQLEKEKKKLQRSETKAQEELEEAREDHKVELARLKTVNERDVKELKETIKVLEANQNTARDLVQQEIVLKDQQAVLEAEHERLDARETKVKDRESKLTSKEEGRYKEGYADGVADGVRKISEITQKDRDNAMKVAMVAASSHTPAANMKEVMNVNRQLGSGEPATESQDS
jgi:chromosome segregation ATPase